MDATPKTLELALKSYFITFRAIKKFQLYNLMYRYMIVTVWDTQHFSILPDLKTMEMDLLAGEEEIEAEFRSFSKEAPQDKISDADWLLYMSYRTTAEFFKARYRDAKFHEILDEKGIPSLEELAKQAPEDI